MRNVFAVLCLVLGCAGWEARANGPSGAVPGEYIVKVKGSTARVQGKMQGKAFVRGALAGGGKTLHLRVDDPGLADELRRDPDVEYVEPNYLFQSIEPEVHASGLNAIQAKEYDQTGAAVRATEAWAISSAYDDDNRPIVAVIDTGLDKNHGVFTGTDALWVNKNEIPGNGIDDDGNGYVDDVNGWNFINNSPNFNDDQYHGTHVAGIVLGATQDILANNLEPAKIRIMPLKFLAANGSGSTSAAINAIYYAVNNGAKVINCSWGGGSYSRALHDAISYAYAHGVLVVTAAGNYTSNNDATPMYPANYDVPSNISVAATSDSDRLASFSNYGAAKVHIGAPGVYVFSTMPGGYFSSLSGTSMAAPFVAGAAALAFREADQLSGYQMRSLITSSATYVSYLSGKVASSARINVEHLMSGSLGMLSTQSFQPDYTPVYQADRSLASEDGAGGGCGLVRALMKNGGAGPGLPGTSGMLAVLMGLPALLWFALRRRETAKDPRSRRRYERYMMSSDVVIKSGDRELVGTMKTISMGGLSFDVDEALEKGGSVTLKISGPNGQDSVEVQGRIVWSERDHAYGVQFQGVRDAVRETLFGWTRSLSRQS